MSPREVHEALERILVAYHALEHAVRTAADPSEVSACLRALELARQSPPLDTGI